MYLNSCFNPSSDTLQGKNTYPTLGKGTSSSILLFQGICWFPGGYFRLLSSSSGHLDWGTFYGHQLKGWPNEPQLIEDTFCTAKGKIYMNCTLKHVKKDESEHYYVDDPVPRLQNNPFLTSQWPDRYCESSVIRRLQIIYTSWYHWYHEYVLGRCPISIPVERWRFLQKPSKH